MTGREAYEEDCRRMPTYPFGSRAPRPSWDELEDYMRESWNKNPRPRAWQRQQLGGLHVLAAT